MALKHTLPKLANFPAPLRRAKRWLLWGGDKIPYYTNGRKRGSYGGGLDTPQDLEHLVDAKTAYAKLKASNGAYRGLGFALGDGWYGVDYDHVRQPDNGEIPAWVYERVAWALDNGMYVEVSPSGTGLHLIGRSSRALDFRNGRQDEHVEAYHHGRYFTMTGVTCWGVKRLRDSDPVPALVQTRPALRLVEDARQPAQIDAGSTLPARVSTGWLADRQTILEALAALSADCPHDEWRTVGMAIHHASAGRVEGLALWEQWSATAAGKLNEGGEPRYVPGHCATRWGSFSRTAGSTAAPVTLGTLIHMARKAAVLESKPLPDRHPGDMGDVFSGDELAVAKLPAVRWLVADLIAPGLTLLAAPPKAGKSYLALQMAQCVAAGKPFLDRETSASPVCYFDLEQWATLIQPRLMAIREAHGIVPGSDLRFRLSMGAGDETIAALTEEIERGVKLIIIDLFARVRDELSEDAKKNAYARDYVAITKLSDFALGYPDVAIVVIHHANKGRHDEWQAKISGSYGLTGGSHANVYMARPDLRGMEDEDRDHAMNYRVLRAQGKLVEEQDIVIEKMPAGGGWQCSKMKEWEIGATLLQGKLMLALSPKYPAFTSAKDIAEIVGRPYIGVRKMLIRMAALGMIESDGQGGAGYRAKR